MEGLEDWRQMQLITAASGQIGSFDYAQFVPIAE